MEIFLSGLTVEQSTRLAEVFTNAAKWKVSEVKVFVDGSAAYYWPAGAGTPEEPSPKTAAYESEKKIAVPPAPSRFGDSVAQERYALGMYWKSRNCQVLNLRELQTLFGDCWLGDDYPDVIFMNKFETRRLYDLCNEFVSERGTYNGARIVGVPWVRLGQIFLFNSRNPRSKVSCGVLSFHSEFKEKADHTEKSCDCPTARGQKFHLDSPHLRMMKLALVPAVIFPLTDFSGSIQCHCGFMIITDRRRSLTQVHCDNCGRDWEWNLFAHTWTSEANQVLRRIGPWESPCCGTSMISITRRVTGSIYACMCCHLRWRRNVNGWESSVFSVCEVPEIELSPMDLVNLAALSGTGGMAGKSPIADDIEKMENRTQRMDL